jgi:hypothetical protein
VLTGSEGRHRDIRIEPVTEGNVGRWATHFIGSGVQVRRGDRRVLGVVGNG